MIIKYEIDEDFWCKTVCPKREDIKVASFDCVICKNHIRLNCVNQTVECNYEVKL